MNRKQRRADIKKLKESYFYLTSKATNIEKQLENAEDREFFDSLEKKLDSILAERKLVKKKWEALDKLGFDNRIFALANIKQNKLNK